MNVGEMEARLYSAGRLKLGAAPDNCWLLHFYVRRGWMHLAVNGD